MTEDTIFTLKAFFMQTIVSVIAVLLTASAAIFLSIQQKEGRRALRQLCEWILEKVPLESENAERVAINEDLYDSLGAEEEEEESALDELLDSVYESDNALNKIIASEMKKT